MGSASLAVKVSASGATVPVRVSSGQKMQQVGQGPQVGSDGFDIENAPVRGSIVPVQPSLVLSADPVCVQGSASTNPGKNGDCRNHCPLASMSAPAGGAPA